MPRRKSPAYQWYPRDYMGDALVQAMTLEQEGAYRRLLDHCWLENGLPIDIDELWPLAKAQNREHFETALWPLIKRKFIDRCGRFHQKRLDQERSKQAKTRKARQLAARKRHEQKEHRGDANASSVQCLAIASALAPASADVQISTPRESTRGKVYEGARLTVSQKQHAVIVGELGADAGYLDLIALYPKWDAQLIASREEFDTLSFCKRKAKETVAAQRRGGALFSQPDEIDWYAQCQALHAGGCGGQVKHASQMLLDAQRAKTEKAAS